MHTNHGPRPDPLTDLGYEPRDINMRKIGLATAFFFGFAFFCVFATWGIIKLMMPSYFDQRADLPHYSTQIPTPPNPLLQTDVTARTDIQDLRRKESTSLHGGGWVDQPKGVAHIPIDRAMEIIVEREGSAPRETSNATTPNANATATVPATATGAAAPRGHGE
jgi:hypothetical protein